ncbi:TetR/AcrR family transcriptional regulator [Pseudaminobacter salicylatoxidans]|uniref:TetR/AcrR family transcriptional regulator n=1 Tax=Pseudaminobacter salicylatoxidans TaxID=93369 RepID=UPI000304B977|nr:TetR/AcrR family transcriptional regulator [Pseudaminobacter salicylatoxidans]
MAISEKEKTMGVDRRRLRGERARASILEHAIAIASTDGLEGLSIGRVATDAGVAKGNIQVLFGDKESLQLATIENAVELYQRVVLDPAMALATPAVRLEALVAAWFDFVEKRVLPGGCFLNAISSEYRARPGRIRDRVNEHRAAIRDRFATLLRLGQEAGEFRKELDIDQLVFELVAFQAAANVAALMGDTDEFTLARSASLNRIRGARV